ncbi:hypothetical protein A1O7_03610 [Cladophialophora yegresii CBS 114405]|uniref:WHIM1 domain-containing protein n=1 Tax=Cladophialophora yegresii CBS 114405 TaxID=1182544 RepID=W9WDU0_9EURO|nr:uncharacterized protein A1O7_03610 [Cladophialophora yegresii CBS 114405]EXJ63165.1 hypothetical protein A1O7_03610 [Cladophialophora yegresii CBS 114405]
MADSDSSSLSSAPTSDDEEMIQKMTSKPKGLNRYFKPAPKPEASPEPPKRAPSPPHEYTLADNDAIAFIVMFRSRFSEAFPKSLPNYGPQDIERGVSGEVPDEQVERLLCALLGLVLNRKKDVERGHYGRALEDAISAHHNQWPTEWKGHNPLHGGKNFNNMSAEERLSLLKALTLWALNSSEAVQALIKESYKQTRRDDDRNQPRSVQPWFSDQYRRKYWLIEGQDDSHFRIYRENDGKTAKTNTWFSVAESIPDVIALADKFAEEHTTNSKVISDKLRAAIPRFEAGEEKRRRRDYRLARKAAFARPDPGFSLYEGRTRGKRMRYTYSDEEDGSDGTGRRSARNSGISTPLESGPTVTASGRQVRSRVGGVYGESILVDQRRELERVAGEGHFTETSEDMPTTMPNGRGVRTSRSGRQVKPPRARYGETRESGESDEAQSSGKEWSGNEDEPDESEPDFDGEDRDQDMDEELSGDDEAEEDENTQESLVVQLRYGRGGQNPTPPTAPTTQPQAPHQQTPTSNGVAVVVNGTKAADPHEKTTESTMGDTIEVAAPRIKLVHGVNSNKAPHYPLPQSSCPVVEMPVQPMNVS